MQIKGLSQKINGYNMTIWMFIMKLLTSYHFSYLPSIIKNQCLWRKKKSRMWTKWTWTFICGGCVSLSLPTPIDSLRHIIEGTEFYGLRWTQDSKKMGVDCRSEHWRNESLTKWMFIVHCSSFIVHRSSFIVHRSSFIVQIHSARCCLFLSLQSL